MTLDEYNKVVASMIELIVLNNAGGVGRALKESGYTTKDYYPADELKYRLFQLHTVNPNLFYSVLNKVEWNYGNNNGTNDPAVRQNIMNALGIKPEATGKEGQKWWQTALGFIETAFAPPPSADTKDDSSVILGYAILALSIIGTALVIWWAVKHIK